MSASGIKAGSAKASRRCGSTRIGAYRNAGFTLVEVVVALTVAAMLMVVVYSAVHLGIRAHRSVAATIDDNDGTRVLSYFLRRQLRQVDASSPGEAFRFTGERDYVRCALRGFRGDPSAFVLELRALPARDPRRLVVTIRRVDARSGRPLSTAVESQIGSGLHNIRFSFFGDGGRGSGPEWQDQWGARDYPPTLLRVSYIDGPRRRRELVLAVAGADGNQVARYAAAVPGS